MIPRSVVLRARDGRYLTATGLLTPNRATAARLRHADARQVLATRYPFYTPLWGLSIEECPKRERRKFPPISVDAPLIALAAARRREEIARVRRLATEHEARALAYREEARRLGDGGDVTLGVRAIDLE